MSKRDELLRRIEQLKREERKMPKRTDTEPYTGRGMDSERMPLGCWIWIIGVIILILGLAGVLKIFQ